jgi:hypothetical protein
MTGRILLPMHLALDLLPFGDRHLRRLAAAGRAPWVIRRPGGRPRVDFDGARDHLLAERGLDILDMARSSLPSQVVARIEAASAARYALEGSQQN